MLKVLKYDWKNGWNTVRNTLIVALILSILLGLALSLSGAGITVNDHTFAIGSEDAMNKVLMVLTIVWFAVMLALLVLTLDAIFRNMSGRMFGPEGYLTHALPVDTWELLLGKDIGTWIFGVFMVIVAVVCVLLLFVVVALGTGEFWDFAAAILHALPKLGEYHFQQMVSGIWLALYEFLAFLAGSFLLVVQFQFLCVAGRQFGKYRVAGGVAVFWVLCYVEGKLNQALSLGFLVLLLVSAACFAGSWWLLKKRLNIQ